jgi:hypothetical protein
VVRQYFKEQSDYKYQCSWGGANFKICAWGGSEKQGSSGGDGIAGGSSKNYLVSSVIASM